MTSTSERFGFDVPSDFPIKLLEDAHASISDMDDARREEAAWHEWAGACNGVLYRFMACAEHCDRLVASLTRSSSPPLPERYEQERLLFNFFAEGLSSLECLYYGVYFVGSLVDPVGIDGTLDPREVVPRRVTERFEDVFPAELISPPLRKVLDSPHHTAWRKIRNVLTHRTAPGREHHKGGPTSGNTYWLGDVLNPASFSARRAWLSGSLSEILEGLATFTADHFGV
jgi:hypothetical protein